jgi:hypothetical protein
MAKPSIASALKLRKQSHKLMAEAFSVENELEKFRKKLIAVCVHNQIVEFDGYEGSPAMDYSDEYDAKRICLICGDQEYGKCHRAKWIFVRLTATPIRRFSDHPPWENKIWRNVLGTPLDELLALVNKTGYPYRG